MSSRYDADVKATLRFLEAVDVAVDPVTVNETLLSHPDYPSLLAVSDALTEWKIPNGAGRVSAAELDSLMPPFIAHTNDPRTPLAVITQVSNSHVHYRQHSDYAQIQIEDVNQFKEKWSGVYLIAEPTSASGDPRFQFKQRQRRKLMLIKLLAAVLIFSLLIVCFTQSLSYTLMKIAATSFMLVFSAGAVISSMLVFYEADSSDSFLRKVCTGLKKGSCQAILESKASKLMKGLTWSEVGLFYFLGGLLCLSFAGSQISTVIRLLSIASLMSIPYPFYSVYYQWKIAKKWCVLCLAVQLLLLINIAVSLVAVPFVTTIEITVGQAITGALTLLLLPALWYSLKPLLQKAAEAPGLKRKYLRFKTDAEVFRLLLARQAPLPAGTEDLGITIGNPAAKNVLVKVCNPFCGPCAASHQKIEQLLSETTNLQVRIVFTASAQRSDKAFRPVCLLLSLAAQKEETFIRKALKDWYGQDKKDYESFAARYPLLPDYTVLTQHVDAMDRWCISADIRHTPTYFFNGHLLPAAYDIDDLKYFL